MNETPIDLSAVYTDTLDGEIHHKPGNDLSAVPHGLSEFSGTTFDVSGLIQLSGKISLEKTGQTYPGAVTGIPVHRAAKALHFLHASSWHDEPGVKIGEYRVHYVDGQTQVVPIVYGVDVVDWWFMPGDEAPSGAKVAWTGQNERTTGFGAAVQFYTSAWQNPSPDVEITEIDFVSDGQESAPFLLAISAR